MGLDIKREFSSPLIKDLGIRLMFDELQDNAELLWLWKAWNWPHIQQNGKTG